MADAFHHGPEIIERDEAEGIVRDVKSAVTMIVGTAPIHLVHSTPDDRQKFINKRIIIRSMKDCVAAFGPNTEGYSIPQAIEAIFNKVQNGQGGGTIIAVNVFDPDIHQDGGTPDPSKVTAADINGTIDAFGNSTGFELAYGAYNAHGFFPKILIAPGFSTLSGIRAKMAVVCEKIHAMNISDLTFGLSVQQAVEQRGTSGDYNTSSERAIFCYPHVKALNSITGDISLQPYSQHFAGMIISTDLAEGYHHSPSNREMNDVMGMERDIAFYPGDYQSETNDLNGAGIVTIRNSFGSGFRTWGNRSAAFPTSINMKNFIHARRIFDMVHESALYYLLERTDKIATPANVELIEEDVNAFLRKKEGEGALYGGRFTFNRTKTTKRDVADGRLYYTLEMMPVGIMERLTAESYLDLDFAKNALGLAA